MYIHIYVGMYEGLYIQVYQNICMYLSSGYSDVGQKKKKWSDFGLKILVQKNILQRTLVLEESLISDWLAP